MTFKEKLKNIDGGRFIKIIDALNIQEECYECYYLNPHITDPGEGYRCACIGSCIAVSFSNKLLSYMFWSLGDISEEQHTKNYTDGKFYKIEDKGNING